MNQKESASAWDIRLPEAPTPLQRSHLRNAPVWVDFMREIEQEWLHYMRHHDSPEKRLREKNPERFRMP
ncbi:MAG: hypothetical protein ACR2F0_09000 [Chthoniobacterales bacterium]